MLVFPASPCAVSDYHESVLAFVGDHRFVGNSREVSLAIVGTVRYRTLMHQQGIFTNTHLKLMLWDSALMTILVAT